MLVAVSTMGDSLDSPVSQVFGRCPNYLFVDTDTLECRVAANGAQGAAGGAGIQAAQFVADQGVKAVITGNVGPNAWGVLSSAGVAVHLVSGGTVREAVEAVKAGTLKPVSGANVASHTGMRGGGRMGGGRMGGGMGGGMGRRSV